MKKFIDRFGAHLVALIIVTVVTFFIMLERSPDTSIYRGKDIPNRFIDTINSLDLLDEDEQIKYFYSDAMYDIKGGFYFISNKRVVLYGDDREELIEIISFNQIKSVEADYYESIYDDTEVTVFTHSYMVYRFPLSSEGDLDQSFINAIRNEIIER